MKNQQSNELPEQFPGHLNEAESVPGQRKPINTKQPSAVEYGGQKGPEPTRYGDWEKAGRCTDF